MEHLSRPLFEVCCDAHVLTHHREGDAGQSTEAHVDLGSFHEPLGLIHIQTQCTCSHYTPHNEKSPAQTGKVLQPKKSK